MTLSSEHNFFVFWCFFFFFLFFFVVFSLLRLHLQHMEVSRLGVKSAAAAGYTHSLWQRQILDPRSKARDGTPILTETTSGP